jgi:sec-independent protein translocase protein TatA
MKLSGRGSGRAALGCRQSFLVPLAAFDVACCGSPTWKEKVMFTPVLAFGVGGMELMIVGVIVLLLFGNRLPGVMRSLGLGITEFKKGIQGVEEDSNESVETRKLDREKEKVPRDE